ncbi:MAG: hypothetical protein R3257_06010, partial [bacterium]|nr:hypothetical protein [bacterium]
TKKMPAKPEDVLFLPEFIDGYLQENSLAGRESGSIALFHPMGAAELSFKIKEGKATDIKVRYAFSMSTRHKLPEVQDAVKALKEMKIGDAGVKVEFVPKYKDLVSGLKTKPGLPNWREAFSSYMIQFPILPEWVKLPERPAWLKRKGSEAKEAKTEEVKGEEVKPEEPKTEGPKTEKDAPLEAEPETLKKPKKEGTKPEELREEDILEIKEEETPQEPRDTQPDLVDYNARRIKDETMARVQEKIRENIKKRDKENLSFQDGELVEISLNAGEASGQRQYEMVEVVVTMRYDGQYQQFLLASESARDLRHAMDHVDSPEVKAFYEGLLVHENIGLSLGLARGGL